MHQVIILDTSVLCCWLNIPGKEEAGSGDEKWDCERVQQTIDHRLSNGYFLVLPLATLIETGNHISQAATRRFELAGNLVSMLRNAIDGAEPWALFSEQTALFGDIKLREIANQWPEFAKARVSIGDYLIKDVADFYAQAGMQVEILTGDAGLKAYEPRIAIKQPRRRSKSIS